MSDFDTWLSTQPEDHECPKCGTPLNDDTILEPQIINTVWRELDEDETFFEETWQAKCGGCGEILTWIEA